MSLIQKLAEQRETDLAAEEKRQAVERQTVLDAVRKQVEEALGDLHGDIEPYSDYGSYSGKGAMREAKHLPGAVDWRVNHPAYGEFWVGADLIYPTTVPTSVKVKEVKFMNFQGGGGVRADDQNAVADFFLERIKAISLAQAMARSNRIDALEKVLTRHPDYTKPEDAEAAAKELIFLNPQCESDYRLMLNAWWEKRDAWKQEEARRADEEQAQRERALAQDRADEAYTEALRAWNVECDKVRQANQQKLVALQAQYDEPFALWELWYALSGRDEDNEPLVSEESVFVLEGEPNAEGMWKAWDRAEQKVVPTRFFTATRLGYVGIVRPSETYVYLTVKATGMGKGDRIKASPLWASRLALLQKDIDAAMLPLPSCPLGSDYGVSEDRARYLRVELA